MSRINICSLFNIGTNNSISIAAFWYMERYNIQPNVLEILVEKMDDLSFWVHFKEEFNLNDDKLFHLEESSKGRRSKKVVNDELFEVKPYLWIHYKLHAISILYDFRIERSEIEQIEDFIISKIPVHDCEISFSMLTSFLTGEVEYKNYPLKKIDLNLAENYNDDLPIFHEKIVDFLNEKDKSGIVLLHGKPGTGKTFYLRYLANLVKRKFVYIPNNLFQSLTSPDFLPSLSTIPGNILLLEDFEEILMSRNNKSHPDNSIGNFKNTELISEGMDYVQISCPFMTELLKEVNQAPR